MSFILALVRQFAHCTGTAGGLLNIATLHLSWPHFQPLLSSPSHAIPYLLTTSCFSFPVCGSSNNTGAVNCLS